MRKTMVVAILVIAVGYLGMQTATIFKANSDLATRVEYYLDLVDENSLESVKKDLIHDAGKMGVPLEPDQIHLIYQDTEKLTYPQQLVERVAQFTNKQVAISVHYVVRILGVPWQQDITRSKIKQVQVKRAEPSPEMKKILEMGE